MSHYAQEDIPPRDGDTQIDMYAAAREITKDSPILAQSALDMIGAALEELYHSAESRGDQTALLAINDAWQKSQAIVQHVAHQAAALNGADEAVEILRTQRESLAYELQELLQAIDDLDTSHPSLELAFDALQQSAAESADEWATESLYADIYDNLKLIIVATTGSNRSVHLMADRLIGLLRGERLLTDLQQDLIAQLLATLE